MLNVAGFMLIFLGVVLFFFGIWMLYLVGNSRPYQQNARYWIGMVSMIMGIGLIVSGIYIMIVYPSSFISRMDAPEMAMDVFFDESTYQPNAHLGYVTE